MARPRKRTTEPLTEEEAVKQLIYEGTVETLSVKVPTKLLDVLRRASAERKRRRDAPYTVQDITREAVALWLRERGFLT